ncbi:MAG TPA: trypsin-like peptidase domain-containing protein [Planctomycetota bacterium]|nr:trypsin-like peptidase domain-containing protein [Planctomycetota bacterium]
MILAAAVAGAFLGAQAGEGLPADALGRRLRILAETAGPSIVAIEVERENDPEGRIARGHLAAHADYFNRPPGPCSGVVYEPDGYIVTSAFNVSGELRPRGIRVTLSDGREFPAELLGVDEGRDVALLKIEAAGLPVLPKADPASLSQGTLVALFGRSPDKARLTVTPGILSALERMNGTAVQTDARMNYGNAGGALVTLRGELVGVAAHIRPRNPWGQSGGVGFACKASEIDRVLARLKARERIAAEPRPYLGIEPGEGNPEGEGVPVALVVPGSPADRAGLKPGDILMEIDGEKVPDVEALDEILSRKKAGDELRVKVRRPRGGDEHEDREFRVKLEGRAGR